MLSRTYRYSPGSSLLQVQRRWISIQQPISTISASDPTTVLSKDTNGLELEQIEVASEPQFQTIGSTNQSTLSITIPPSFPIHVRKGSIMAMFPSGSITSSSLLNTNFREYLAGLTFQKVISTTPVRLLVSSYVSGDYSFNKAFVNVILDGTKDWVIFNGKSIQAYTGNDIEIVTGSLPSKNWMDRNKYVLVKGRGLCGLVGNGDVFKVSLNKDESLQVRTNELLAFSTSNSAELKTLEKTVWKNGFQAKEQNSGIGEPQSNEIEQLHTDSTLTEKSIFYLKKTFGSALKIFNITKESISDYIFGNGEYYTVKGPRTVLIQSGSGNGFANTNNLLSQLQTRQDVKYVETFIQKEEDFAKPQSKVGDNLGVIRLINGEVQSFKNVENFKDEVERIEKLKQQ